MKVNYPRYSYFPHAFLQVAWDALLHRPRSFRSDGVKCLDLLDPPLVVRGRENIPSRGPCLILFNHYYRPGFQAWWIALAISSVLPVEIHYMMTGELTFPGKWYAPLGQAVTRWALDWVSISYGFTTMPPMPPRTRDVEARASAVRKFLIYKRHHPDGFLGLAPEGGDNPPTGALAMPSPGVGRFIHLLCDSTMTILPVGAFEEEGEFHLHFGKTFKLQPSSSGGEEEKDRLVTQTVMASIAGQLPARLRGNFSA